LDEERWSSDTDLGSRDHSDPADSQLGSPEDRTEEDEQSRDKSEEKCNLGLMIPGSVVGRAFSGSDGECNGQDVGCHVS